ncbi:hypothetical protein ACHAWF_009883 [Thalassiosira exigua]
MSNVERETLKEKEALELRIVRLSRELAVLNARVQEQDAKIRRELNKKDVEINVRGEKINILNARVRDHSKEIDRQRTEVDELRRIAHNHLNEREMLYMQYWNDLQQFNAKNEKERSALKDVIYAQRKRIECQERELVEIQKSEQERIRLDKSKVMIHEQLVAIESQHKKLVKTYGRAHMMPPAEHELFGGLRKERRKLRKLLRNWREPQVLDVPI